MPNPLHLHHDSDQPVSATLFRSLPKNILWAGSLDIVLVGAGLDRPALPELGEIRERFSIVPLPQHVLRARSLDIVFVGAGLDRAALPELGEVRERFDIVSFANAVS